MALRIDTDRMTSQDTAHFAVPTPDGQGWAVSWLPGQTLDRNQAITAMTVAEVVATELPSTSPWWLFLDVWAAELGLTVHDMVGRAAGSPATGRTGGVA
jgi:hypothetical protein